MGKKLEKDFYEDLAQIIEQGKQQVVLKINSVLTLTYWHIGKRISDHVLQNERAEYGKEIVARLSQ